MKISKIAKLLNTPIGYLERLNPLVNLFLRFWMADVFLKSAILKMPQDFLFIGKGNWSSTLYLFEYEHPLPFLPAELAALIGTSLELILPILLILGIATRFSAVILFAMTAFIEFTYQQNITHIYWMILLAILTIQGAGKISLDHWLKKKFV